MASNSNRSVATTDKDPSTVKKTSSAPHSSVSDDNQTVQSATNTQKNNTQVTESATESKPVQQSTANSKPIAPDTTQVFDTPQFLIDELELIGDYTEDLRNTDEPGDTQVFDAPIILSSEYSQQENWQAESQQSIKQTSSTAIKGNKSSTAAQQVNLKQVAPTSAQGNKQTANQSTNNQQEPIKKTGNKMSKDATTQKVATDSDRGDLSDVSLATAYSESSEGKTVVMNPVVVNKQPATAKKAPINSEAHQAHANPEKKPAEKVETNQPKAQPAAPINRDDTTITPSPVKNSEAQKPTTPAAAKLGLTLKHRFKLVEHIGDGGMSQVFKAKDLRLEAAGADTPFIAIKILSEELGNHPEALKVMARECQKTRELSHPNIVKVFDYDTCDNINFITMELLEGESLDKVIQRAKPRGLEYKGALNILEPICQALDYAHQHGIVHADLKPSNIFLTRSGEIKIFDFGVVRALSKNKDKYSANIDDSANNPKTGGYTPAYASLEMLNGDEPDLRDDLYALGCIAYELLSSRHPFNKTPANQIKEQDVKLEKCKNIPASKWKVLKAMLSLNKNDRPASAMTFLDLLQNNQFGKLAKIAAGIVILGAAGFYTNQHYSSYQQINENHLTEVAKSKFIADLENADRSTIMAAYEQLSTHDKVIQLAFLRAFRGKIIDDYQAQIEKKKTGNNGKFADFVGQIKIIDKVEAIFPDSQRVQQIKRDVLTSRTHLLQAKEYKFNNLLQLQQYAASDDGEDVYTLLTDMRTIKPGFSPQIVDEAAALYGEAVKTAIREQNYALVESLLNTGETIFPEHNEYKKLVAKGGNYHSAANQLALYQASLAKESPLPFPHAQAKVFYSDLIEELATGVSQAESQTELDSIFDQITQWSEKLPYSFRPLDDLRKLLSSKYVSLANKMNKQRKFSQASPLFQKAEKLLSYK
ncbi:protein kinase domain-containing protein [Aliikangiella maris]|uniref:Protein kinase n=2 Tax=Aliikangiella maris TaxID=3162458 RepID=A0ABV3MNC2_9GAMM